MINKNERSRFDKFISTNVVNLMKKHNTPAFLIAHLIDVAPSTMAMLLQGNQSWRISHLVAIAEYYSVTIDELVFGDPDYIQKNKVKNSHFLKNEIRKFLTENKKFKTLGELEANGFFKS